jgi:selenium metabolism protein YedF
MKVIDACSKPCPQPVIETKNAMEADPESILKVIVNDEAAKVNVTRFAAHKGYSIEENVLEGGVTELTMTPGSRLEKEPKVKKEADENISGNTVYFLRSYGIGTPDKELGNLLVKTFFQTLPNISPLPGKIVFMHGGVQHTVEGAQCLESLIALQELGVDIVVCGTCLDYYEIKEKIKVGRVSNFLEIATILSSSSNTITL